LRVRAAHDLEIQRHGEEQPEHDEGDDRAEGRSPGERARSEEVQVDERCLDPPLPEHERAKREHAAEHLRERRAVAPAYVAGVDDAVGEEGEPAGREGHADQVDALPHAAAALRH
jgi:hypothetical protein